MCVCLPYLLWNSLQVEMGMKASAWEASMTAADTTSEMNAAFLDAILASCGEIRTGLKARWMVAVWKVGAPLWCKPSF